MTLQQNAKIPNAAVREARYIFILFNSFCIKDRFRSAIRENRVCFLTRVVIKNEIKNEGKTSVC